LYSECIKRIYVWGNCLTYNLEMRFSRSHYWRLLLISLILLLASCSPATAPSAAAQLPDLAGITKDIPPGFTVADGSRKLTFPQDFGAHPDFRTEWWYYTGNLNTPDGQHFGFELTIFRVGLLPPTVVLPTDSGWYNHSLYFAHFAISDIAANHFYAYERYSRPGPDPGLAGAQADPFHVWLEDWSITGRTTGVYHLQAAQGDTTLDLTLTDEMGVVLQGDNGYSRKGVNASNASYYYSQPRLRADGSLQVNGVHYTVSGLVWHDHEFGSGTLDQDQIGWDWFALQFEDGPALMLFQIRQRDGSISASSSGTFVPADRISQHVQNTDFKISVLNTWRSPHTQGVYPAAWEIHLDKPACTLKVDPWMADQEVNFPSVTYWEGAVHFEGTCNGTAVKGNGYVELTGYAGKLPLR
jgi:predicted secreted hydrolase